MYAALCAPCHGKDLKGYAADNAPSLVTQTFLESATDEFLAKSISTGRPSTSMAAYAQSLGGPLDAAAIDRLVKFIRSQGASPRPLAAAGAGDAKRGAELYARSCASCHGDTQRRLEGIHLANPMFLAQATDAFIRHAIVHGRPGTKMVAFGGILSNAQIDDLVAHLRSFDTAKLVSTSQLPPPTGKEPIVLNPKGKAPVIKARDDRFVSVDAVHAMLKAGNRIAILDARPPSDWMRAHIEGAVSFPYHEVKRLAEIPKDVAVFAYCACPHHLSGIVVDELRKLGHTKAYVLDEGVNDWHRKGYPMTTAPGVAPPPLESHAGQAHGHEGHKH